MVVGRGLAQQLCYQPVIAMPPSGNLLKHTVGPQSIIHRCVNMHTVVVLSFD